MQVLLINDMVGHSKVGMGAMMPVLSYLGHSAYGLPTALVSNTFNYGLFNVLDTTDYIRGTLPVWKQLGFRSDAICTGYMYSEEQAQLVSDYCREQAAGGTKIYVDPVMGDGGSLYNGLSMQQVEMMRRVVAVADLTFPNYTEAALLTGIPYQKSGISPDEARQMLKKLQEIGAKSVLITSCIIDGQHCVVGFNHLDNEFFQLNYEEIPGQFHGTGDLFSAFLIGYLLNGKPLKEATRQTMDAVSRLISLNKDLDDKYRGILVEQFLHHF